MGICYNELSEERALEVVEEDPLCLIHDIDDFVDEIDAYMHSLRVILKAIEQSPKYQILKAKPGTPEHAVLIRSMGIRTLLECYFGEEEEDDDE